MHSGRRRRRQLTHDLPRRIDDSECQARALRQVRRAPGRVQCARRGIPAVARPLAEGAQPGLPRGVSVRVGRGAGARFVLDPDGAGLTNAHRGGGATPLQGGDPTGRPRGAEQVAVE